MKEAWWKSGLSYLWDIQVDYRSSEYNPDLIVLLSHGRYQLCTSNAVYSYEEKYHNYTAVLKKHIDYNSLHDNKILLLGLGLGSIPIIMDGIKPSAWDFTAVEIDEEVCDLAAIYGYPKISSEIKTIITDARIYMSINENLFDIVCVDLFVGDNTPQKFRTEAFLHEVKEAVSSGGYVIYNTPAFNKEDRRISMEFYNDVFSKVFEDSQLIDAHRNYMLLWQCKD